MEMTWHPSLVKLVKRKLGSPPLGLRNLGNSCYLNSVLQCLTHTPPLAAFCLRYLHSSSCDLGKDKKGDCPFCILEKRIARSLSSDSACDAAIKLNNCLRIYAAHFRSGRQEDAHEFLRYVIDACHNTCLRLKKLQQQHQKLKYGVSNGGNAGGMNESVVKEIFGGALQSQVKCLSCGTESNKVDEIMDISLDILQVKSLKEALQKFFQPEVLDGNNKYKCDNCKELVTARKQMSILEAPNVLVIQLKRFEGIFGGKVDKPIAFDDTLVLSSYMCKASQDLHPEYNLFGTIIHSGYSPDSGHYYAYIKDAYDRWYCCNDSFVSVSTLQEVLSEKVYILFFARAEQRPPAKVDVVANGSKAHEFNGSKTPRTGKLGCLEKTVFVKQIPNGSDLVKANKPRESNGVKAVGQKTGCFKPINFKISKGSISSTHLASNGTKASTVNGLDHASETNTLAPSLGSNPGNSAVIQKSDAFPETPVNMKDSSNHHSQRSNQTGNGVCSQQNPGSTSKLLTNGSINICKRESKENGYSEPLIATEEKENNRPVCETNGMSKKSSDVNIRKNGPLSVRITNGQCGSTFSDALGHSSLEVNGHNTKIVTQNGIEHHDLQNGDVVGLSSNSGMKRKIAVDRSCLLLAGDDKSRAEVESFKELIGKEASEILRSCGWSDEVYKFMHEKKKICRDAGDTVPNRHDVKSVLISDAKKHFISKLPESLKARLVEQLKTYSQEKQASGT